MTTEAERYTPQALPIPNEPLKNIKARLLALWPKFTENKRVEVDPELVRYREYAAAAAAQWKEQATIATLKLAEQLGDAHIGTVNGVDVIKRHQDPVTDYPVEGFTRDYWQSVKH